MGMEPARSWFCAGFGSIHVIDSNPTSPWKSLGINPAYCQAYGKSNHDEPLGGWESSDRLDQLWHPIRHQFVGASWMRTGLLVRYQFSHLHLYLYLYLYLHIYYYYNYYTTITTTTKPPSIHQSTNYKQPSQLLARIIHATISTHACIHSTLTHISIHVCTLSLSLSFFLSSFLSSSFSPPYSDLIYATTNQPTNPSYSYA